MQSGGAGSFLSHLHTAQPHWDITDCQHVQSYLEILFWPLFEPLDSDEKGWERKDFFLGQPRLLHPLVAKEKAYYPWGNNMAYLNCKGIDLKTSTHMLLAGEDKKMMKIRKGGKKWLSFIVRKSSFPSLVSLAIAEISYYRASGKIFWLGGWLV